MAGYITGPPFNPRRISATLTASPATDTIVIVTAGATTLVIRTIESMPVRVRRVVSFTDRSSLTLTASRNLKSLSLTVSE